MSREDLEMCMALKLNNKAHNNLFLEDFEVPNGSTRKEVFFSSNVLHSFRKNKMFEIKLK